MALKILPAREPLLELFGVPVLSLESVDFAESVDLFIDSWLVAFLTGPPFVNNVFGFAPGSAVAGRFMLAVSTLCGDAAPPPMIFIAPIIKR